MFKDKLNDDKIKINMCNLHHNVNIKSELVF